MTFKISTDEASPQKYPPHGKIEYEVLEGRGELLHIKCFGPFNKEVLTAVQEVQNTPELLNPNRKEIIEFVGTCMGGEEFIASVSGYVAKLKEESLAPKAVALVIAKGLEGGRFMKKHYQAVYLQAGIEVNVVETFDEAQAWLGTLN